MGRLLKRPLCAVLAAVVLSMPAAAELSDRHRLTIALEWSLTDTHSELAPWTSGGPGKLRYDTADSPSGATRAFIDYTGRIAPHFFGHAVADYVSDNDTVGLTEAYVEWRPLPVSLTRHRVRFGAFYPALSFENPDRGWDSPYANSFSAFNTWVGEEIRPVGAEWTVSRRIGAAASPHELSLATALFFGNDTAGTLLFWRGWAVHDRQTRLNERLPLPTLVFAVPGPGNDIEIPRQLDPLAEIDHEPGVAITGTWQYGRRAKLALGFWDNRADAMRFRDGQWAWGTRFWHLSAQISLPAQFGLIAQHMHGDTDWLIMASPDGVLTDDMRLVTDEFETQYLLLSRAFGERHRVSLRFDRFDLHRPGELLADSGDAHTLAYSYAANTRLDLMLEWQQIDSTRELWPAVYNQPQLRRDESLLQLSARLVLFDSTD